MTTITRSLTLNGFTATVSIPTKLDAHKMLTCTLKVAQAAWATNSSETAFTWAVEVPATAATAPAVSAKDKHVKYIKGLLDDINAGQARAVKEALAKALYDYLTDEALDFVKTHERFRAEVVKKAYDLKGDATENAGMCSSINRVLQGLGEPLVKPAPPPPAPAPPAARWTPLGFGLDAYVAVQAAPAPANPVVKPAAPPTVCTDTADLALLAAVARKYKCDSVLRNTKEYLGYWRRGVARGDYRGFSKAEAMEKYISSWCCVDENMVRERLLHDIFNRKNLEYSPVIMDMYNEWVKTYVPPANIRGRPKPNRWTKMCAFVEENKAAFINL
jgi:hypothetical protein